MLTTINDVDVTTFTRKFDEILSRGLCKGLGEKNGQMCIEAAITCALDLPFDDSPICVTEDIQRFKISLNDSNWSSPVARANGLRDLGIAQLGSKDVIFEKTFSDLLYGKMLRVFIPTLFREIFPKKSICLDLVAKLETSADLSFDLINAIYEAASYVDYNAAEAVWANCPAIMARYANLCSKFPDKYLLLCAQLALETLKELKSPGCEWI